MENAAQLSAATVGFEHEDTQDHKDDDGMDVRGGEGCLQASADGIQYHPHGNQNTQSCIQADMSFRTAKDLGAVVAWHRCAHKGC